MNLLVFFIILNTLNVIIQTVKSLATIKCGKLGAAIANAIAFGLYTIVLVYMNCELPLWEKVIVVSFTNFIGVYTVKWFEEKIRKDKMWKIEVTVPNTQAAKVLEMCEEKQLSFNYIDIQKYVLFNFYCPTQEDSQNVKDLLKKFDVHYFITEAKTSVL